MELLRAVYRFLLSPVVIVTLLASTPRALAADETVRKPASLSTGKRNFILAPTEAGFVKAVPQHKFLDLSGIALFERATDRTPGFTLNELNLPLILARGGTLISNAYASELGGTVRGSNPPVAHTSRSSKPVQSVGPARFKTGGGLLTVDPTTINFGSEAVGSYQNQMGTLIASDSEVTISSATISSPEFTLSGVSFPFTIPAGGRQDYTVEFMPQAAGTASATLTFITDGNVLAAQTLIGIGGDQTVHTVYLSWNASTSPTVVGYNVYRGSTSGGLYVRINSDLDLSTVYTDASVLNGNTYYYVVTAIDGNGQESAYSNEVQAVIP